MAITKEVEGMFETAPEGTQAADLGAGAEIPVVDTEGLPLDEGIPVAQPEAPEQAQTLLEQAETDMLGPKQGTEKPKDETNAYWQGQYDKSQSELVTLKAQVEQKSAYDPILERLASRPELLQQLMGEAVDETQVTVPVAPAKPDGYDRVSAFNDPESTSWKYREENEQYTRDSLTYATEQMRVMNDHLAYRDQQEKQRSVAQTVKEELQMKFGYTPDRVADFFNMMQTKDAMTLDNLVKLHQISTGTVPQNNRTVQSEVPPAPVATGGGAQHTTKAPGGQVTEADFMAALKHHASGR
jgi:hypothetical protein|tara:strand:+ start:9310 stop:10203 length:894 start_codon:yes stop_codon:yes gene_type:complete